MPDLSREEREAMRRVSYLPTANGEVVYQGRAVRDLLDALDAAEQRAERLAEALRKIADNDLVDEALSAQEAREALSETDRS